MTDRKGDPRTGRTRRRQYRQSVEVLDRRRRRRLGAWLAPLVLVAAANVAVPAASASGPSPWPAGFPQLPLGPDDLAQQVTVEQLAPGVHLTTVVRGQPDPDEFWTVTIKIADDGSPDPDAPQKILGTGEDAQAVADRLVAAGFSPRVERVDSPGYADFAAGELGWQVRVGHFATKTEANQQASALRAAGYLTQVDFTGDDGLATTGPWRVRVVTVDRTALAQVQATYGKAIGGRETTSAMSRADGALAAINAGFFIIESASGFPGEPSGLGVYDGRFDSEAVNGRAGLVLDGERSRIGRFTSASTVIAEDGAKHVLNGVNRKPGIIHLCGQPGSQPSEAPQHAFECTNPNDMVLDTPDLSANPAAGAGMQATLDPQGHVTALGPLGEVVNRLPDTAYGDPTIEDDPDLGQKVATFDGVDDAYAYDLDGSKMAGGFTIECKGRFNGPLTSPDMICDNTEGAGVQLELAAGRLRLAAHIGGGYKYVYASQPITQHQWYDVAGTWDGSTLRMYLDGQLVGQTAATGAYKPATGGAAKLTLGGGDAASGVTPFFATSVAAARVYSRALSDQEVADLYADGAAAPSIGPGDVLNVDFSGPAAGQQTVLQATGTSVDWLKAHAAPGTHLQFVHRVRDEAGHPVPLTPQTDIVAGGPLLVRQGEPFVDVRAEGDVSDADPSFIYGYGIRRNPRTLVGFDAEGRLLLVAVDGRQPGYSAGLQFTEAAQLMRALGAVDALNLDGGGSTTMAIRGELANSPSDAAGERPVGDAIEVLTGEQ